MDNPTEDADVRLLNMRCPDWDTELQGAITRIADRLAGMEKALQRIERIFENVSEDVDYDHIAAQMYDIARRVLRPTTPAPEVPDAD